MKNAKWIKAGELLKTEAPLFAKEFVVAKRIVKATLSVTARGVYEAYINGERIGNSYFTPGWTVYEKRIQVQKYDITAALKEDNRIEIQLANGWYLGRISGKNGNEWVKVNEVIGSRECGIIAELFVEYADGTSDVIATDTSWDVFESEVKFCDFYDGIVYDASAEQKPFGKAVLCDNSDTEMLCDDLGVPVKAQERIKPVKMIVTPKGETVIDFGQNFTGVPEISLNANKGDKVKLSFAEILDKDGNFYNGNYRTAKCIFDYTCEDGSQVWHPSLTFYGFRYIRVDEFPAEVTLNNISGIVLHSEMKKTGELVSSSPLLNRLISNIFWGQKCNYLDVPTDCPQRDERLGWTGDAQIFVRTASYNFDVSRFFKKWLGDLKLEQLGSGEVPPVIPAAHRGECGAAWGDAVTICPWQMYLTYADKDTIKMMYPAMKKWVDFITNDTADEYLWTGRWQYGDWVELNAPYGECKGLTRDDIVASAYYAYSALIVSKTGKILGEDAREYEALYKNIVRKYKETFKDEFFTQTEHVVTLYFGLTDEPQKVADSLVRLIEKEGGKLQTGFVGTPYLLHVLSDYGYSELAYKLLLRTEYPSWLYPVTKGATTMWEHWDGIMPDGRIWPDSMNSYNHYAYGAVADWMYGVAAGINTVEEYPGFERILIKPTPTHQMDSFGASIETKFGKVSSRWWHEGDEIRYEIITPSPTEAVVNGKTYELTPGSYRF